MKRKLLIACAVVLVLPVVLWGLWEIYLATLPGPKLPSEQDVVQIHATIRDFSGWKYVEFDVPRDYWARLFGVLSQAKRDDFAAKWQSYGDLKIVKSDGTTFVIDLYILNSPKDEAAFKVVDSRTYYRGGSEAKLMSVLDAAKAAAKSAE
jgi:hypothetical protein